MLKADGAEKSGAATDLHEIATADGKFVLSFATPSWPLDKPQKKGLLSSRGSGFIFTGEIATSPGMAA